MSKYNVFLGSAAALLLIKFLQKVALSRRHRYRINVVQHFKGMQNLCWAGREDSLHYVAERVEQHGPATVQGELWQMMTAASSFISYIEPP